MFGKAPGCLDEAKYSQKINQPVIKFYPDLEEDYTEIKRIMEERKGVELC